MSRVYFGYDEPEVMGLFGFSWQEKTGKFMYNRLKGSAIAKKLKSFWNAGGVNKKLIDNMHREYAAYMALGYAPSGFTVLPNSAGDGGTYSPATISLASLISQKTNIDSSVVLEFLRAMFVLSRDGKIAYSKWNPAGYKESKTLQKTFKTEITPLETITSTVKKSSTSVLVLAALGVGVYLYTQFSSKRS